MRPIVLAAACLLAAPGLAFAHNGGLDSNGCHNNKAKNVYECHQGPLQGQTFKSKAEADARLAATNKGAQSKANPPAQQTAKTPEKAARPPGNPNNPPAQR